MLGECEELPFAESIDEAPAPAPTAASAIVELSAQTLRGSKHNIKKQMAREAPACGRRTRSSHCRRQQTSSTRSKRAGQHRSSATTYDRVTGLQLRAKELRAILHCKDSGNAGELELLKKKEELLAYELKLPEQSDSSESEEPDEDSGDEESE
ncbi:MAG: hypothetical protein SGPRY_003226 [Prymnesium sp.]